MEQNKFIEKYKGFNIYYNPIKKEFITTVEKYGVDNSYSRYDLNEMKQDLDTILDEWSKKRKINDFHN